MLVPLRIASSDSIWLADRHWLMLAMIGMPPATEASKAIERPSSRARSNSSGPCSANSALLAVTRSLPLANSSSVIVRAGSNPPTSRATAEIVTSAVIRRKSSLTSPGGSLSSRFFFGSLTTTAASSIRRPAWRNPIGMFDE